MRTVADSFKYLYRVVGRPCTRRRSRDASSERQVHGGRTSAEIQERKISRYQCGSLAEAGQPVRVFQKPTRRTTWRKTLW